MQEYIGIKIQIYPDKLQEELLFKYCSFAHRARNFLVAKYKDNEKGPVVGKFGIKDYSTKDLMEDMKEDIPQRIALGVIKNVSHTWQKCYSKLGKKPRFHKYRPNRQSFYVCSQTYYIKNNRINIPLSRSSNIISNKIILKEKVNFSEIIEPYFTYCRGKWYVSGSIRFTPPEKRTDLEILGLDWGIKNFMTSSKGELINYPKSVIREFYRINKLKSIRDKKVKGSNNYNKVQLKIDRAYNRLYNLKKNFIEQTTTRLCKQYDVAIEDLTNKKIKESNKTFRRRKQTSPLTMFTDKLEWKCKKYGSTFYKVNPAYTSQTCSCCGNIKHNLTIKDRVYKCEKCGNVIDRDVNAAINISAKAVHCSL